MSSHQDPGFLVEVMNSMLNRVTQLVISVPEEFMAQLKRQLDTFNWLWVSSPGEFFVWTIGFANVPLDTFNNFFAALSLIPADAFIDAAVKRIRIPTSLSTRVIRADQALFMAVDIIATAGRRTAKLQLPSVFRTYKRIDALKSRIQRIITASPFAGFIKKIGLKFALFLVSIYVASWNLLCTGFTILVFGSLLDRIGDDIPNQYVLQQKNPIIKDELLGRKRKRLPPH